MTTITVASCTPIKKTARCWLLPALATLILGACTLSRPNPDQSSWLVMPERTAAPRATPVNMHLKMGNFSANAPYDGKSLVYRMSENKYEKDFYNVYLIYPRDMVANATQKWLTQSNAFSLIVEQPTTFFPIYQLQGVIDEFYGDYRDQPTAVVTIQFYASASFNAKNGMFSTPRITKRVPLADKSTQALITGQQQALTEVLQELEQRLVADAANAPADYVSVTGRHVTH
jgi:cholesterol transport system auxiliary component